MMLLSFSCLYCKAWCGALTECVRAQAHFAKKPNASKAIHFAVLSPHPPAKAHAQLHKIFPQGGTALCQLRPISEVNSGRQRADGWAATMTPLIVDRDSYNEHENICAYINPFTTAVT